MEREILTSLLTVGVVATILGAGALAYFSDTETSSGNTLQAGTLDLKIRDQDEPWGDGVTATWTALDMKPGDSFAFDVPFVGFRNGGSIEDDHLEITCGYEVIEESPQTESDTDPETNLHPDEMAKQMIITRFIYSNATEIDCLTHEDPKWRIEDQDGDDKITFYDLKHDPLDDLPPPNLTTSLVLSIKFSEDATNDFQGDTFVLTMIFTLNQDSSQ